MKELKDLIRARRSEIGKTFEEIGKEVGVSKATVLRWESGEIKDMRRDKLVALAKALKTTPSYLMGWEEAQPITADTITDSEMEMITALRSLPADVQDSFHAAIKGIAKSQKP